MRQGFEEEAALLMHRHFPGALLAELRASCLAALVELAEAFPYQPAASSIGLTRFTQVLPWLRFSSRMPGPAAPSGRA